MPKIKPTKLIMAAVIAIALIAAGWYFLKPKEQPPQYITAEVTQGDIESSVLATGILEATKMVSVGAQVSGQVRKMYVELGDQVKQGQLIARIDSVRQENDLKTAEASIKNQMAQLAVRQANLAKVEAEYNRQKAMYAQDATSRSELESAFANYKTAQADITAINAQIEQSRLTLATAKEDLGYTQIVAPMDGTIVAIVTEEGQTVNANQSAPTIVKLAKLDTMTIKAEISEADVMKVEEGQTVYFTTLGNNEKKIYAKLRQVEPAPNSINTDGNTSSSSSSSAVYYNALFDVPNEDGKLRIDMTAQVYIVLDEAKNVLTIPAAAIQGSNRPPRANRGEARGEGSLGEGGSASRPEGDSAQGNRPAGERPARLNLSEAELALIEQGKAQRGVVRVLQADGTAKPTPVLIGLNNRATAQVLKGLKRGDQVVIADGSDTSNDAAKRGGNSRGPMRM
ncbi:MULTISPECIES: MacA family efflux pump subunit [Acinetobacter]|jgi:membrane fusion protein, macrolide-specific efflux system|uniref:Macrolide-specific efflux system membrane fusion protein n=1 Tax=Acinetobacter lwoffii TaxID=28090 RepID=A0AAW3VEE2_ACILW|nr:MULTISPECIES: MacA family efflux pump subunit [Acinetobacter]KGH50607.1 secretion protein HylD [Acinetobacter idrijaensis]ODN54513.1 MacA family efflux pump subunit [Acinetobacter sp. 51m]MBB6362759.1 macrolide-specific efflux system membrane fusion protein [Acinetobacter lwoffii]MEB6679583.1 MacA family efflux pump subunit [Acinetobacter lwoffii]OIU84329.1 MacA family efflux pump subunit [Acinetobacter sp. AR2-3]